MSPLCLSVIRRASVATYDLQCILCGPRNKGTQRAATSKVQSVFITLEGWGIADVELCSDICNELQNCGDTWTPSPQSGVLWGMCGVPSLFYRMTERHLGELSMWAQGTDYAERGWLRGFRCIWEDLLSVLLKFMWSCLSAPIFLSSHLGLVCWSPIKSKGFYFIIRNFSKLARRTSLTTRCVG